METTITKKRAVLWVVLTIIGPLLFSWFFSACYISVWYARTRHQGPPPAEIMIQGMFVGVPPALWTAVILWWLFYRTKAAFSELYLTRSNRIGSDIAIGLCLGTLWVAIYALFEVVSWQKMSTFDYAKFISMPASVSAGFCEEFLYRGFLFWIVALAGGRKASTLIVSSIAFGLAHCFWGPWGMLWTTILGFTFGLAVLWRGNVWAAVIAHALLNLCIEPGLIENALTGEFSK